MARGARPQCVTATGLPQVITNGSNRRNDIKPPRRAISHREAGDVGFGLWPDSPRKTHPRLIVRAFIRAFTSSQDEPAPGSR